MARKAKERAETFQFHKGAIRTMCHTTNRTIFEHFNSIKVRLEPISPEPAEGSNINFNSIKVRLERQIDKATEECNI